MSPIDDTRHTKSRSDENTFFYAFEWHQLSDKITNSIISYVNLMEARERTNNLVLRIDMVAPMARWWVSEAGKRVLKTCFRTIDNAKFDFSLNKSVIILSSTRIFIELLSVWQSAVIKESDHCLILSKYLEKLVVNDDRTSRKCQNLNNRSSREFFFSSSIFFIVSKIFILLHRESPKKSLRFQQQNITIASFDLYFFLIYFWYIRRRAAVYCCGNWHSIVRGTWGIFYFIGDLKFCNFYTEIDKRILSFDFIPRREFRNK